MKPATSLLLFGAISGILHSQQAPATLATLTTQDGHVFVFGRSIRGDLVVAESAPIGSRPLLAERVIRGSISTVYSELSEGQEVPEVLKSAEATAKSVTAAAVAPPLAPAHASNAAELNAAVVSLSSVSSPLTPNQQWFQSTICSLGHISFCDLQNGDANTSLHQWAHASNYYAYGLNDSSNVGPAHMYEWVWTGASWQFDWASPPINQGTYWYEYWWNSNPVYRATDLVAGGGPSGMATGGFSPSGLEIFNPWGTYFTISVGGPPFKTQFPNDAEVACYLVDDNQNSHLLTKFSTNGSGMNVGLGCYPQAWYNQNPRPAFCQGVTTGQVAGTSVLEPYFSFANCSFLL